RGNGVLERSPATVSAGADRSGLHRFAGGMERCAAFPLPLRSRPGRTLGFCRRICGASALRHRSEVARGIAAHVFLRCESCRAGAQRQARYRLVDRLVQPPREMSGRIEKEREMLKKFLRCIAAGLLGLTLSLSVQAHGDHRHAPAAKVRIDLGASAAFDARSGDLWAVYKQGDHVMLTRSADAGRTWSEAQ